MKSKNLKGEHWLDWEFFFKKLIFMTDQAVWCDKSGIIYNKENTFFWYIYIYIIIEQSNNLYIITYI